MRSMTFIKLLTQKLFLDLIYVIQLKPNIHLETLKTWYLDTIYRKNWLNTWLSFKKLKLMVNVSKAKLNTFAWSFKISMLHWRRLSLNDAASWFLWNFFFSYSLIKQNKVSLLLLKGLFQQIELQEALRLLEAKPWQTLMVNKGNWNTNTLLLRAVKRCFSGKKWKMTDFGNQLKLNYSVCLRRREGGRMLKDRKRKERSRKGTEQKRKNANQILVSVCLPGCIP